MHPSVSPASQGRVRGPRQLPGDKALHLQSRPQACPNEPLEFGSILGQSPAAFPSDLLGLEFHDHRDAGAHGCRRELEGDFLDQADAHTWNVRGAPREHRVPPKNSVRLPQDPLRPG